MILAIGIALCGKYFGVSSLLFARVQLDPVSSCVGVGEMIPVFLKEIPYGEKIFLCLLHRVVSPPWVFSSVDMEYGFFAPTLVYSIAPSPNTFQIRVVVEGYDIDVYVEFHACICKDIHSAVFQSSGF